MKLKLKYYLLLLSIVISINSILAQSTSVNAKMDSTQIWIGDQTDLHFQWEQKPNQIVQPPIFSDTVVNNLEIVERAVVDTTKLEGKLSVKIKIRVTSFKDTLLYVPPFPFVVGGDTVWSNSLSLKVIQPFKIDTASNKLTDIKPIYIPKFDWKSFFQKALLILLILVLCVILFILIRKYINKRPNKEIKEPEKPKLPAHIIAIKELERVKREKLWQNNRVKEYHTDVTDILREYIDRVFNIRTLEMTTDEILAEISTPLKEKKTEYNTLKDILVLADLVKFAKYEPMNNENELSLANAYIFVNKTKIEDIKDVDSRKVEPQNESQNDDNL